jgi:hypothetical protein
MYNKSLVIPGLIIFLLVMFSPVLYNALSFGLREVPKPEIKINESLEHCVEDTDYMRAYHMTYLKEGREQIVREGIRETNKSITKCIECHPARGEFCTSCKDYVGIRVECWDCHYYPEEIER